jgi:Na+-translocating ferredoxin:NAD+ oxidoreductase RnfC subunit
MQKKASTRSRVSKTMIVTVSKFGDDPLNVTVPVGASVADVLEAAGIETSGREQTFVEGEAAEGGDILENGDILSIVTPKQAG